MEDMIRYILDIDRMARDMTARAEELKNKAQAEIPLKKEKLREEFLQKAQARIQIVEEQERKFAEEARAEKQAEYEKARRALEEQFELNRECWVRQIVDRAIRG